ncbi:type II toxin-antitoxin system mRNA interferase toxin, RelE/StbE family [Candidatus Gottesmanbacteria bacterium]|nr:type II toxin-antitoxin system mRNA interferase toxin, RelE/StbE family [Candidatus Gottesmanbacteria bacterium]
MIQIVDIKMEIRYSPKFLKQYKQVGQKIQFAYNNRVALFLTNPYHPLLHNHMLTGKYSGFRSINITGDWRALYKEVEINDEHVIIKFHLLGHIVNFTDKFYDYLYV